ncbi:MAG: FAD-dependent oxidoreductase [Planctomycetota bacterium]
MKIVIVGCVAGGASAAARARRLDASAEIIAFEKGEHPSFANCGLPYYVGGVIEARKKLLVAPIDMLRQRHRLDVRPGHEVTSIDTANKTVRVRDLEQNREFTEHYDKLILSPGATPIRPDIPGINSPRVLSLRDLADADRMHAAATADAKRAVIVGAGFIGVEVAENLVHRGIHVTVLQQDAQILSPWDPEMITPVDDGMRDKGIEVLLNETAIAIQETDAGVSVETRSGRQINADFVVACIGVSPDNRLAVKAGLRCAERGGIQVNAHMQTSDPDVYAVGDAVEVVDFISNSPTQIPLAGPANRQGRIAADHIFGRASRYRGTQGTAVVGVFDTTAAMTGLSEKSLRRLGRPYEKIYLHPMNHAGYYPGAQQMTLKLLFAPDDGRILGAQAVGKGGVEKRIDVIATAIQAGMTVEDLEEAELCYAPQYGHAKDAVNMAGFIASNVLRGDHPIVHVNEIPAPSDHAWIDVRTVKEFEAGHIPHATNIPIEGLPERLQELSRDRPLFVYCRVGQRGYMATRFLNQHGFQARNLSGGYLTYRLFEKAREIPKPLI